MSKKVTGLVSWLRTWFDDIYELKGQGGASVDDCYPEGSIYFTTENVNPSTWVGGNWSLITNSFSVGGETVYAWKRTSTVPELSVGVATPILSYADSQSTQVFASYTEGGVGVGGKYVSFVFKDKNNNTVYSTTAQTNNNGVATTLYGSQGVGDVTISVECMSISETSHFIDAKYYASNSRINSEGTSYNNDRKIFASTYTVERGDEIHFKFNSVPTGAIWGIGSTAGSDFVIQKDGSTYKYWRNVLSSGTVNSSYAPTANTEMVFKRTLENNSSEAVRIYNNGTYLDWWTCGTSIKKIRVDKFNNSDFDIEVYVL